MYMHVAGFMKTERGPQEKREKSQGSERESNAIWGAVAGRRPTRGKIRV